MANVGSWLVLFTWIQLLQNSINISFQRLLCFRLLYYSFCTEDPELMDAEYEGNFRCKFIALGFLSGVSMIV